jgi:hypothetical protein
LNVSGAWRKEKPRKNTRARYQEQALRMNARWPAPSFYKTMME